VPKHKIALIGHSGAGKSECLRKLGGDPAIAEMDKALGTGKPPTMQQALEWIVSRPQHQDIVVFGVHINTLNEIACAKARKDDNVLLAQVRFVYLRNKDRHRYEERLRGDPDRSEDNVRSALENYESLNVLFNQVADHTIDTAYKDIAEVIKEVLAYRAKLTR
jgi:RNase adaptor protein for sRNA GlmZ degradation